MTDQEYRNNWQISRTLSGGIITLLIAQTIGVIIWAARLDYRVQILEASNSLQDARIDRLDQIFAKVAIMDDRQNAMVRRMDIQTDKMNQMLSMITASQKTNPKFQ